MTLTPAAPTDLTARYPAFAAVAPATAVYWLADATRYVDESWPIVTDRVPAMLAVAAHNMMKAGVQGIAGSDVAGFAAAGVTDFKSGQFSARFSDDAVKQAIGDGYASTSYGQEYAALLERNKGGSRVTAAGAVPCMNAGLNGYAGPMPYPAALWPC